jgi:hypothetical protein
MQILKPLFFELIFLTFKVYGQSPVDIVFYLNNKQVSKTAKDFYHGKFKASDDAKTLSILDSVNTNNNLTRPFYIYLVSKMLDKSDGALAEALSNSCKEFVELNPDQAIEFLYSHNKIVDKKFIDAWASQIASEFMTNCEKKEKQCIEKSLRQALTTCKVGNKKSLTGFYKKIESYCH